MVLVSSDLAEPPPPALPPNFPAKITFGDRPPMSGREFPPSCPDLKSPSSAASPPVANDIFPPPPPPPPLAIINLLPLTEQEVSPPTPPALPSVELTVWLLPPPPPVPTVTVMVAGLPSPAIEKLPILTAPAVPPPPPHRAVAAAPLRPEPPPPPAPTTMTSTDRHPVGTVNVPLAV